MKVLGDIEAVNLRTGERWQRVTGDGESVLRPVSRGSIDDVRLGPSDQIQREITEGQRKAIDQIVNDVKRRRAMHYRNGREAKNGDRVVQLGDNLGIGGQVVAVGVLHSAVPGNDYCNGSIAPIQNAATGACLCDCLHLDDVAAMLKEKGLDKRPAGK